VTESAYRKITNNENRGERRKAKEKGEKKRLGWYINHKPQTTAGAAAGAAAAAGDVAAQLLAAGAGAGC
jgi:hypothetical protein